MKMRVKPIVVDVEDDDGMWLNKSTYTYYNKDQLEPIEEPKGLDEVAEKYESHYDVDDSQPYLYTTRGDIAEAFRNGAKWMAEQGITCEGRVSSQQGKRGIVTTDVIDDIGDLMVADKVIVQIRKKDG